VKTAIALPGDIFVRADRLARRLRRSRSQLHREAVAEYLARHDPDAVTEAMDAVCATLDTRPDDFMKAAARRVLGR
jgi:predicted transcriptional regulator